MLINTAAGVEMMEFLSWPVWLCHWASVSNVPPSSGENRFTTTLKLLVKPVRLSLAMLILPLAPALNRMLLKAVLPVLEFLMFSAQREPDGITIVLLTTTLLMAPAAASMS